MGTRPLAASRLRFALAIATNKQNHQQDQDQQEEEPTDGTTDSSLGEVYLKSYEIIIPDPINKY